MATFPTNRALLNPKFEGYKLSQHERGDSIAHFPLSAYPTQANVSGRSRTPLSFEEVQSRITHNHLAISQDSKSAVYVDGDLNLIQISLNPDLTPTFSTICELPKPIQSDELAETQHREYPSSVSLGDLWLISDGTGLLYVLPKKGEDTFIAALYHLPNEGPSSTYAPFRIHAVQLKSPGLAVCVLSYRSTSSSDDAELPKQSKNTTQFEVVLAEVPLDRREDAPQPLKVQWQARGDGVPIHVSFDDSREAFFVLGNSVYTKVGVPTTPAYEPTSDELAPIPRAGETLPDTPTKPPPYSWTQTSDTVTVAFALPSNVPKSAIHVTLTAKTLSLLIKHELPISASLPRYALKQLWDSINPSSSFWTWDREADKSFGLLTLHLDKQHEDTRWAQVFKTAGVAPSSEQVDPTDEEVPETLDPSELYAIRESLEKYTGALQRGEDASGLGLGSGMPSLAEGELDDAVDSSVGRQFVTTWFGIDGSDPVRGESIPSSLLSVPVPGLEKTSTSLIIRNDIDGLYFTLPPNPSTSQPFSPATWTHTSTFPALAFVLASKRDTRFTFHISHDVVLAFESGTGTGGGNVYMYYGPPMGSKEVWAKQSILKVSGGEYGALLGVGALLPDGGKPVLLCLCERELVIV